MKKKNKHVKGRTSKLHELMNKPSVLDKKVKIKVGKERSREIVLKSDIITIFELPETTRVDIFNQFVGAFNDALNNGRVILTTLPVKITQTKVTP